MSHNADAFDKENVDTVQDNLSKVAKDLGKQTKTFIKDKQEEVADLATSCSAHIKANPLRSIAIGFAAGYLISKLLSK